MENINPLYGQIAFLTVALFNTVIPVMIQFRWRAHSAGASADSYYKGWDDITALGTNYWMYANYVYNYGSMAVWGVALLTQLLSTAGLFADINTITWMYGVTIGGLFLTLSYEFLQLLGIQTAYSNDGTGLAGDYVGIMTNEWLMVTAGQAFSAGILASNKDSWW